MYEEAPPPPLAAARAQQSQCIHYIYISRVM